MTFIQQKSCSLLVLIKKHQQSHIKVVPQIWVSPLWPRGFAWAGLTIWTYSSKQHYCETENRNTCRVNEGRSGYCSSFLIHILPPFQCLTLVFMWYVPRNTSKGTQWPMQSKPVVPLYKLNTRSCYCYCYKSQYSRDDRVTFKYLSHYTEVLVRILIIETCQARFSSKMLLCLLWQ